MNDDDLFIALVLAATAAGHPLPLSEAQRILRNLQEMRGIKS